MRIGMLVDSYYPYISGVTNHIAVTKKYLEKQGHEVFVFTFGAEDFEDSEPNIIRSPGVPLIDSGLYFGLGYSKKAKELVKTMDVVHIHHPFISGFAYRDYLKPFNIPGVFTNHTRYDLMQRVYLPVVPEGLGEIVIKSYLEEFFKDCSRVVAPSKGLKDVLLNMGMELDITVIPNGIELQSGTVESSINREALGIKETDMVFIYVGRIAPEKNLSMVINAFAGIVDAVEDAHLLIVGDGPDLKNLKDLTAELECEDQITFTGEVDYSNVPSYLNTADVFATASVAEVHPLTLLEAFAAKLPVVGIHSPGVGDIVEDGQTGLLAENNLASFTAVLTKIALLPELRHQLAENAFEESSDYAVERTAGLLLDLYKEVVAESKAIAGTGLE